MCLRPMFLLVLLAALTVLVTTQTSCAEGPATGSALKVRKALIKTSMGDIEVALWPDVAPETVRVFLGLADGRGTFTDVRNPSKKVTISKPFFDGLKFHRVIKGFMLQGGCPEGTGTGNAGFMFADEINAKALGLDKMKAVENGRPHGWMGIRSQRDFQMKLVAPLLKQMGISMSDQATIKAREAEVMAKINALTLMQAYELMGYKYNDKLPSQKPVKGVLALANAGPNTNSSQFFINLGETPHLAGKHTVFGKVTKGMDIVEKIGQVRVGTGDKPVKDVKILSIRSIP